MHKTAPFFLLHLLSLTPLSYNFQNNKFVKFQSNETRAILKVTNLFLFSTLDKTKDELFIFLNPLHFQGAVKRAKNMDALNL